MVWKWQSNECTLDDMWPSLLKAIGRAKKRGKKGITQSQQPSERVS